MLSPPPLRFSLFKKNRLSLSLSGNGDFRRSGGESDDDIPGSDSGDEGVRPGGWSELHRNIRSRGVDGGCRGGSCGGADVGRVEEGHARRRRRTLT